MQNLKIKRLAYDQYTNVYLTGASLKARCSIHLNSVYVNIFYSIP